MNQSPTAVIPFTCSLSDARFAISFLGADEPARLAIIIAAGQETDPDAFVTVALKQSEILLIANLVRLQGEGVATGLAQRLTESLLPLLAEYPTLYEGFLAIKAANEADFKARAATGAEIITKTLGAIGRQVNAAVPFTNIQPQ